MDTTTPAAAWHPEINDLREQRNRRIRAALARARERREAEAARKYPGPRVHYGSRCAPAAAVAT